MKTLKIYYNRDFDDLVKDWYDNRIKEQSKDLRYFDREPSYNYFDQPSPLQLLRWEKEKKEIKYEKPKH